MFDQTKGTVARKVTGQQYRVSETGGIIRRMPRNFFRRSNSWATSHPYSVTAFTLRMAYKLTEFWEHCNAKGEEVPSITSWIEAYRSAEPPADYHPRKELVTVHGR